MVLVIVTEKIFSLRISARAGKPTVASVSCHDTKRLLLLDECSLDPLLRKFSFKQPVPVVKERVLPYSEKERI